MAQAAALALGRIVVVQPLLATSVVFALPLGARFAHKRVSRPEVAAALAVTAGLGAFLVLADPSGGVDDPARGRVDRLLRRDGAAVRRPHVGRPRARAGAPRGAAGHGDRDPVRAQRGADQGRPSSSSTTGCWPCSSDWHLYALIVVGYVSMTLSQASLQAGALAPAVATQMALDPVASLFLGDARLRGDDPRHDTGALIAALAAFAVMIGGIASGPARRRRRPGA